MKRNGVNMVLSAVIVLVVLLIFASVVSYTFTGNFNVFAEIVDGNLISSDRELCLQNVERYCNDNPGERWDTVHSSCTDIQDIIENQIGGSGGECPSS